jgi:hypothetical protein
LINNRVFASISLCLIAAFAGLSLFLAYETDRLNSELTTTQATLTQTQTDLTNTQTQLTAARAETVKWQTQSAAWQTCGLRMSEAAGNIIETDPITALADLGAAAALCESATNSQAAIDGTTSAG